MLVIGGAGTFIVSVELRLATDEQRLERHDGALRALAGLFHLHPEIQP